MTDARTILVPVDFSRFSHAAIERALVLAEARGSRLRLLHVLQLPHIALEYDGSGPVWSQLRASEMAKLEELRRKYERRGVPLSMSFEEGDPASLIRSAAQAPDVDLVVIGSHGLRGFDRVLIGSVVDRSLRRASTPMLVVREDEAAAAGTIRSILLATDFSDSAEQVESTVCEWARVLNAEVEVLHVVPESTVLFAPYALPEASALDEECMKAGQRALDAVVARLRRAGVDAKPKLVCGYASREITQRAAATGVQIIAMGSRGHSGLKRFRLGSVVQRVLADAACSVLVGHASREDDDDEHSTRGEQ